MARWCYETALVKESNVVEMAQHGRDEDVAKRGITDVEVHCVTGSVKLDMGRSRHGWSRAGWHRGCWAWGGAARCG
jgi:hypothetical protein